MFIQAQHIHPCGTPPHKSEWFKRYQVNKAAYRTGADTLLVVPMTIHNVGTDAGSGYTSMMSILDAFCALNNDFAVNNANMKFYIEGDILYIDSTAWYNHSDIVDGYNMMMQNNVANTINTYIVTNPAGNAGYNLPAAQAIAMRKSYMNSTAHTWAHEVGHNLSVQHPFLGWEGDFYNYNNPTPTTVTYDYTSFKTTFYNSADTTIIDTAYVELVDGSNCSIAADGICDTGPDYLSFGGWLCNAQGQSQILQKDPNNVDFRSDGSNIMTYANDACGGTFTAGQIAAMRANLLTQKSSYLYNQNLQFDTITDPIVMQYPIQGETVNFASVGFGWNAIPGATKYLVQVSFVPSFSALSDEIITSDTSAIINNLLNNRTYYWRVRPYNHTYTCAPVSASESFFTADLTAVEGIRGVTNYRFFPSLVHEGQAINVELNLDKSLDAEVLIIHSNGQIVQSENIRLQDGFNQHQIETQRLEAGIYIMMIRTDEGMIRDKFVVMN
jgi:hypothetical protein